MNLIVAIMNKSYGKINLKNSYFKKLYREDKMPILSFGSQNIDLISGKQKMTIRKLWKKPLKVGDKLHCYWNLVSKERKKIFEAEVTDIKLMEFKDIIENDDLAKEEGYENSEELEKEFKKMYTDNIKENDIFQIIYFEKLPVEEWEGEKIDEKAMIMQRADILFESGKYQKSAVCYDAALRLDPNDVYILNKIGDNLSRLGNFEEAINSYNDALKIEPENEYIWNNKAIALLNYSHFNEALKASDKAIGINPNNSVILYWRGIILEVLGKNKEALDLYEKLTKIDSKNPEIWNAKGTVLANLGRVEEALEAYNTGLELCLEDEISPADYNRKGNALLDLGRYNEALNCYDEAIALDKDNEIFWSNKGVVLMELDRFREAILCFDRVLTINPKNEDVSVLKEECLENL